MANHRALLLVILLAVPVPAWAELESRPGVAVDARGNPVVDPTKNVLDLVEAAVKRLNDIMALNNQRQDDLRAADAKLFTTELTSAAKLSEVLYRHSVEVAKSLADQLNAEARLRAEYDAKLREAESKRIDAIRLVDTASVAEDRRRTGEQAVALATQVSQSADTVRALVASTKTSTDLSTNQITEALSRRITTLEQASYQTAGQQKFQDPAFVALVAEVKALTANATAGAGKDAGISALAGWIAAILMLFIALGGFALNFNNRRRAP